MRLEIEIVNKLASSNSCSINHEIELRICVFEFFQTDIRPDFAASLTKARDEVIEVNRRVRQWRAQRETAGKIVFTLGGADNRSTKRNRPLWNFNFAGTRKLARFDNRDPASGKASKIEEHSVGFERPWDDSAGWLNVVGKPNRRSGTGGCSPAHFFCENRSAIAALGENDATREARHARADNCGVSIHFQMVGTDRRAVPKIFWSLPCLMAIKVRAKSSGSVYNCPNGFN